MSGAGSSPVQAAIASLAGGQDLGREEAKNVFRIIMQGEAGEGQIGALLALIQAKGAALDELVGAASVMREMSLKVEVEAPNLVDTCGTGGSGAGKLFNVSTAAAFVAAAVGAQVAKHGNRRATGTSGSADVLELAGAAIDLGADQIAECIRRLGVGFLFAPAHHSATRHVMPVRRTLGIPTVFNLLGPMTNPARTPSQVIGVSRPAWLHAMAEVLRALGSEHVLLVHSHGLDEIALDRDTQAVELSSGEIRELSLVPEDFGVERRSMQGLNAENVDQSLDLIRVALTEPDSSASLLVRINAAAAIYVSGLCRDLVESSRAAAEAITSGAAHARMQDFVALTRELRRT